MRAHETCARKGRIGDSDVGSEGDTQPLACGGGGDGRAHRAPTRVEKGRKGGMRGHKEPLTWEGGKENEILEGVNGWGHREKGGNGSTHRTPGIRGRGQRKV
ncbi:hypothetical protein KIL84_022711 [Mauremys mutica]|uniref:Uncharacterized protein n=1 Tax=Mauremys mutica TaxID=74926 RepID=A0A9D3WQ80_9SAUR|nr:hypothetical protein KIL84_022711 [Mauremys mutica]